MQVPSTQVNAAQRVSARIKQRLEELGWTGRRFAKELGHGDPWISGLLANRFALSLAELDKAASVLNLPPSELVRLSDAAWELSPSEKRLVRGLRVLPPVIRDHIILLVEYLIGVTPEEVTLLQKVRRLSAPELKKVDHWIDVTLLSRSLEPETAAPLDFPSTSQPPAAPIRRTPRQHRA